jgi:hypothetical protein
MATPVLLPPFPSCGASARQRSDLLCHPRSHPRRRPVRRHARRPAEYRAGFRVEHCQRQRCTYTRQHHGRQRHHSLCHQLHRNSLLSPPAERRPSVTLLTAASRRPVVRVILPALRVRAASCCPAARLRHAQHSDQPVHPGQPARHEVSALRPRCDSSSQTAVDALHVSGLAGSISACRHSLQHSQQHSQLYYTAASPSSKRPPLPCLQLNSRTQLSSWIHPEVLLSSTGHTAAPTSHPLAIHHSCYTS